VIVELAGLPGSGKSFLAPKIAAEHGVSIVRVGRLGQRRLYALLFGLLHPRLVLRLLATCRAQSRGALRRMKTHRLVSALAKEQKARMIGGGLIDEGIFQILLTLYETPAEPARIEEMLSLLPKAAYRVCFVEAAEETRQSRMQARGKTPRSELGPAHQEPWQRTLAANLATLKSAVIARFDGVTVRNDGF
jgi:dephospho-CoA kinase